MRKIGLTLGALLVSLNCYAGAISADSNLRSAILKSTSKSSMGGSSLSIIYGGQDFSRPIIATANESLWAGLSTSFIG